MTIKHTPEPWGVHQDASGDVFISSAETSFHIAEVGSEDDETVIPDARRIVACVNACRGLPTDELEQKGLVAAVGTQLLELDQLRYELLEALEEVHRISSGSNMTHNMMVIRNHCADAIAKAKGGAA
ncbi:hypothetical protein [Aeromonas jandaei]|uniref:hypothetical protein n=1 Tax=Aeromonas jandaei TaxID=650 RepID=UPI003B9F6F14